MNEENRFSNSYSEANTRGFSRYSKILPLRFDCWVSNAAASVTDSTLSDERWLRDRNAGSIQESRRQIQAGTDAFRCTTKNQLLNRVQQNRRGCQHIYPGYN
jgi:hypothetical protein